MSHDIYCEQVLTGKISISKVKETEHVLAFHHTKPTWPVHIVVIPKYHEDSLISLVQNNENVLVEMMHVLTEIIDKVKQEHGGCRLTTNFGRFQNSKHLHWHIYVGEDM